MILESPAAVFAQPRVASASLLRLATVHDIPAIMAMRRAREDWMTLRGIHQWAHRNRPYEDYLQQVYDGVWHVIDARVGDPTFAEGGLRGAVRLTSLVEHAGLGDPGRPALFAHGLMADLRETGNGVGTQLLTGMAHLARERGLSLIRISCVEPLIPFYTKFGFRLTGATTSFPTSPPIVTYVMDYEVG